ncbi:cell shape determination protein CcmA [Natrinema saccharevitans]|uniref:Cell shape determination protein CcmA n=1 Tax=Natrinema saccharevitans TaxID=301967 RepID=A0A1S8B017_9EURY|nr:polymer-forming cytoskeletal protein [Natrinema saccharevitans]OLZ42398.1 cell shape determination protein CcmA [Natrinema saccharevitans]
MVERATLSRIAVAVLVVLVVCGTVPATVAAQSNGQTGGTVVVEEDETVDSLEAFGGTVVVRGTVTGDVSAVGGDVRIERTGEVGGDLEAAGGSVTVAGTVDGDVDAGAGSLTITEDGTVGGAVTAGVGTVTIDGTIEGDAEIGAETIRLGETASIAGDLRYDGDLEGNTDAVAGEIEADASLGVDVAPTIQPFASWLFTAYALAVNLLLGALLLGLFPRFSDGVADRVASGPLRSGLVGLAALVVIPVLLIALAISVVGLPLSFVGGFVFALLVWVGIIYGRFAIAAWILSLVGLGNRWLALVVGLVAGALLSQLPVPIVGEVIGLIVLLLGLGGLVRGLVGHWRTARGRDRERSVGGGPDEPTAD